MICRDSPLEASDFPSDETALGIPHSFSELSSEQMQHSVS